MPKKQHIYHVIVPLREIGSFNIKANNAKEAKDKTLQNLPSLIKELSVHLVCKTKIKVLKGTATIEQNPLPFYQCQ